MSYSFILFRFSGPDQTSITERLRNVANRAAVAVGLGFRPKKKYRQPSGHSDEEDVFL